MSEPDKSAPSESIALRAFSMLEQVARAAGPLSLEELTVALGLPKPSVFRIANLLRDADLLSREPASKRYTMGPRLAAFAIDLWRSDTMRQHWHGALEEAVAAIGESCNLTLLEGDKVLYLDRVETNHPLRLHLEAGTRVPLHCTASGKLFLSAMAKDEVQRLLGREPYERFTPKTLTSLKAVQADLARVRKTGIGTHDSERFADSVAIAVPVLGRGGEIVAAVAMHAPSSRASLATCMGYVDALRRAASKIALTLTPSGPVVGATRGRRTAARPARRTV
ncbi:MAG: IclR family transcriptional regulator [Burkholderiales bacterium]|nr:IclR family transcriptional regulator [Burkholderiales bacterium]MDE1926980.1 IclR family transcriptional regulator [Burkholderiales bacterium]MDE2159609.1 IclR family transcriptional regulator [Burkholderiales bacterium]MDE2503711.1 IclR family transcriptional regulator [Burkholderiales bacterium]